MEIYTKKEIENLIQNNTKELLFFKLLLLFQFIGIVFILFYSSINYIQILPAMTFLVLFSISMMICNYKIDSLRKGELSN